MEDLRSDDLILDWKLQRGESGDVLDPDGKTIFKPGTMQTFESAQDALTMVAFSLVCRGGREGGAPHRFQSILPLAPGSTQ